MNKQPTVGSILHYYTAKSGPEAAIVTGVVSTELVDIHVFGHGRPGFDREAVWLRLSDKDVPRDVTSWCQWPPRETYARPVITGKTTPSHEFLPDLPGDKDLPAASE